LLFSSNFRDIGVKEIISFGIASSKSELEWYMSVESLYRRWLNSKNLNLMLIDGAPALMLAAGTVYHSVLSSADECTR